MSALLQASPRSHAEGMVWMDVFRHCRALRSLGSAMVLLVLALVGFNYYVTVWLGWHERLTKEALWDAALLAYNLFVFLLVWCYVVCASTEAGNVPPGWRPVEDVDAALRAIERGEYDRADHSRPRYCRKCVAWKPERAHHCSVCGVYNTKPFLLFLVYTCGACILSASMLIPKFMSSIVGRVEEEDPKAVIFVLFIFILDVAFALSILGFLVMHLGLIFKNMTTIEMYEKVRTLPWRYDQGIRKNFEEVFGRNKLYWFIPLYTREDRARLVDYMLEMDKRPLLGSVLYEPADI